MLKHYILLSQTLKYKTQINQQLKRYTSELELDWSRLHREDRQDRNVSACFFTNKNIICLLAERENKSSVGPEQPCRVGISFKIIEIKSHDDPQTSAAGGGGGGGHNYYLERDPVTERGLPVRA